MCEKSAACTAGDLIPVIRVLPDMVLETSALSYLGLGIKLPAPEWGAMLSEAGTYMRTAPHMLIFPGLAIVLFGVSMNLMGDGLRDALDPKLRD